MVITNIAAVRQGEPPVRVANNRRQRFLQLFDQNVQFLEKFLAEAGFRYAISAPFGLGWDMLEFDSGKCSISILKICAAYRRQPGHLTRGGARLLINEWLETLVNIGAGKHNRFTVTRVSSFAADLTNFPLVILC
jgi:hypothetical protein